MLRREGIGSPAPVAYYTERNGLLFTHSYYACLKSECPYSYVNLMRGDFPGQEEVLRAIARTTAALHEKGYLHKDYSRGNILFRRTDKGVEVEIIDLNRIRFRALIWKKVAATLNVFREHRKCLPFLPMNMPRQEVSMPTNV